MFPCLFQYNLTICSCCSSETELLLPLLSQQYILSPVPRYQLLSIHSSHILTQTYIINTHHGSKHRRVRRQTWGTAMLTCEQYNGYGQSNPYGSNSGYDTPPTYSTSHYPPPYHLIKPSVRSITMLDCCLPFLLGNLETKDPC